MLTGHVLTFVQEDSADVSNVGIIGGNVVNTLDLDAKTWTTYRTGRYIPNGPVTPVNWDAGKVLTAIQVEIGNQEWLFLSNQMVLFDIFNVMGAASPKKDQYTQIEAVMALCQANIAYLQSYIP